MLCFPRARAILFVIAAQLGTIPSITHASDIIRLIPSTPPPPPILPEINKTTSRIKGIKEIIGIAGPLYNQQRVFRELQGNFDLQLTDGLKKAAFLGQDGVLLLVQVAKQQTDAGAFYSLVDSGVSLVGVGGSADSVCFAVKCYSKLASGLPAGATLSNEAGYVWVARKNGNYVVQRYQINALEGQSLRLRLDTSQAEAFIRLERGIALKGYAQKLNSQITQKDIREKVANLLRQRQETANRILQIEKDLYEALRRAERAAAASALLSGLSAAFNLASAIYMVNASLGEDLSKQAPNGIYSHSDLKTLVETAKSAADANIDAVRVRQSRAIDDINKIDIQIIDIGIKYKMPPNDTILRPIP